MTNDIVSNNDTGVDEEYEYEFYGVNFEKEKKL